GIYVRADAIACIARTIEREALSRHAPRERVHYLPNAIDMTRFRPPTADERVRARQRFGIPEHAVVTVFLGRLSREKGVAELLEAWRLLQPLSEAHLIVAGPDMTGHVWDLGPTARAFVTSNGLDRSVHFIGPTDDVPSLMHAADAAVQPSHFEALGLS